MCAQIPQVLAVQCISLSLFVHTTARISPQEPVDEEECAQLECELRFEVSERAVVLPRVERPREAEEDRPGMRLIAEIFAEI